MSDTPMYDRLVDERLGRAPHEFEGHETWESSEEARAAFDKGAAEARRAQPGALPSATAFARHAKGRHGPRPAADR